MTYSVSPRVNPTILGPRPMEKRGSSIRPRARSLASPSAAFTASRESDGCEPQASSVLSMTPGISTNLSRPSRNDPTATSLLALNTAGRAGGTAPAVFNASNEVAVGSFLDGRLRFVEIPGVIERTLEACGSHPSDSLDAVKAADGEARERARGLIEELQ